MYDQQYSPRGFSVLPPVVKNLLIINGLVFLAQIMCLNVFKLDLVDYLGLHYYGSSKFNPAQFVTYMFLHSPTQYTHIIFNMFALWMFGYLIENVWGSKRFLIYYLVTGIGAALIHMVVMHFGVRDIQEEVIAIMSSPNPVDFENFVHNHFPFFLASIRDFIDVWSLHPNDMGMINQASQYLNEMVEFRKDVPTVGASGAVFGILLAFGMLFPNTLIYIYFLFPIKAKWFVIFYGGLELFFGIRNQTGDNVAHFAHLGGMIFGFFLIRYWNRKRKNEYWDQNY